GGHHPPIYRPYCKLVLFSAGRYGARRHAVAQCSTGATRGKAPGMKAAALYGGLWMLIAALFLLMPDIDLAASRLFYDGSQGFFFADWLPLRMVVGTVPWIVGLLIVLAVIATAWLVILRKPLWRFDRKALLFVTVATVLGPGLIAYTVLKVHWLRARPYQIAEFGGARH